MPAVPKIKITEAEYLAMERASDTRHEFFYGEVFAMAGASLNHNRIAGSVYATLYAQLKKRPCDVFMSDMRLKITSKMYTYPDIVVVCGELKFSKDKADTQDTLLNPTVIIEVLSPSTEDYDRSAKLKHYQTLESLQEYVLIAQDTYRIDRLTRQSAQEWRWTIETDITAPIDLVSIQCSLALADVYEKVSFEDQIEGNEPDEEAP